MFIAKITAAYERLYGDSGQRKTYVEWIDNRGRPGRTEGTTGSSHMQALLDRAEREGVAVCFERW